MRLEPDGINKVFIVTHSDGTTEVFQTRAAAIAMYPILGQPIKLSRKQEHELLRREAKERGNHGGWGISRSGRR